MNNSLYSIDIDRYFSADNKLICIEVHFPVIQKKCGRISLYYVLQDYIPEDVSNPQGKEMSIQRIPINPRRKGSHI